MRVLLFILMLTLLPLRGWMGDAMATGMALAELQAVAGAEKAHQSVTDVSSHAKRANGLHTENKSVKAASALSDCTGHAGTDDSAAVDPDHCTPCSACGACHTASMSTATLRGLPAVHGSVPAARSQDAFLSADAAPSQKPPIA